ncbi:MAG TPA: 50S ribosomal protein L17 [Armatimonadota bacterium]|jgi:large subunit ribosomal protein L17
MRHNVGKRKLGLRTEQRMALLKGLVRHMVKFDRIDTTITRAKEAQPLVEKIITLTKDNTVHSRRMAFRLLQDETLVKKLFTEVGPKFADKKGGYTRITRLGVRRGDAVTVARLEYAEE